MRSPTIHNWVCYYGNTLGPELYSRFDLVVLDGTYHPPLAHHADGRPIILGYVSVGEVEEGGHLWPQAQDQSYLIKKNEPWHTWVVDVRDHLWQRLLLESTIPAILAKGFDGLLLDTIDSSLSLLSGRDGERFAGTLEALQRIVLRVKEENPDKWIALNRGLPLIPSIAKAVDFVVIEGLYSCYGGPDAGYRRVDQYTRDLLLQQVGAALQAGPELQVLTLDYAPEDQPEMAGAASSFARERGFIPYVNTHRLDQVSFSALQG